MKAILALLSLLFLVSAHASNLMYPELNVAPKASERLKIEERLERKDSWTAHLPVQMSALATIVAAAQIASADLKTFSDPDQKEQAETKQSIYSKIGLGVGVFWLGATVYATTNYRPYREAYLRIKKNKGNSIRDQLTRERLAEEELKKMKKVGRTIRWASAATNLLAAGLMGEVKVDTEKSNAQIFSNVAALVSLAPLFFTYSWEDVADQQDKYKKKIYSPVAFAPIMANPFGAGGRTTGMNLIFAF